MWRRPERRSSSRVGAGPWRGSFRTGATQAPGSSGSPAARLNSCPGGTNRSPSGNSSVNRRLLLDSHAFLWAAAEPENLTAEVRSLLENPATRLHLSAATVWELLIKARKNRIDLGGNPVS